MSLISDPPRHPLLRFADGLETALDRAHDSEPLFMSPADRRDALVALHRAGTRLQALQLRILAAASSDDAGEAGAFRDTTDYLATSTNRDVAAVRKDTRLAAALDDRWKKVGAGLADGRVTTGQAGVIVRGLEALPDDLDATVVADAETVLVDLAGKHPPAELRRLARRILDYVAPDLADLHEARALEAEERRAREAASLHIIRNADGVPGLSKAIWKAPDADINRLLTYLDAYTSPRHVAVTGRDEMAAGSAAAGERPPVFRQRALAMLSLLEHLDPAKLPQHAGTATTLIVTIDHDVLMGKIGTAGLLNGDRITAAEARRLACTAGILPAVLDGKSHVLDLGRSKRYFTAAQITAMRLRDKRCRSEGCTQPAEYCEAHHKKAWRDGGKTNLEDGVLLCPFHHHRIEDERYLHEYLPNGDVRFTRRT